MQLYTNKEFFGSDVKRKSMVGLISTVLTSWQHIAQHTSLTSMKICLTYNMHEIEINCCRFTAVCG